MGSHLERVKDNTMKTKMVDIHMGKRRPETAHEGQPDSRRKEYNQSVNLQVQHQLRVCLRSTHTIADRKYRPELVLVHKSSHVDDWCRQEDAGDL